MILVRCCNPPGGGLGLSTYVILLRAVNVAGYGKLSMAEFRTLLTRLGFDRVETYIQSGNAIVDANLSAAEVGDKVAAALLKMTGSPIQVLVRTHKQLDRVVRENPFATEAADGTRVHVAFLSGAAAPEAGAALQRIVAQYPKRRDRYHLAGDHIYFHLPDGAAETKFTGRALDKALGVIGTGRNWNTVLKLHALSNR